MTMDFKRNMIQHRARSPCKQQPKNGIKQLARIQQDVENLHEWLVIQRHLTVKTDYQQLLKFLCGCKFSLQRAKEKLEMSFRIRALAREYFANRDPLLPDIQEYLTQGHFLVLPDLKCHSECRTLLIRCQTVNCDKLKSEAICIKILTMILDVLLLKDDTSIATALQIVIDMRQTSHKCIMKLTPSFFKKIFVIYQNMYPIRLKAISIINTSKYFESMFCWIKTLIGGKIKDRIYFNTDQTLEAMFRFVPLSILPKEYGGESSCINDLAAEMKREIENYREWFMKDIGCLDEPNICETPTPLLNIFETESLRTLDLDYQEYVIYCKQKYQSDQDNI